MTTIYGFFASLLVTFVLRASLFVVLTSFAVFAQQPRIDRLSPSQAPISGGTVVSIVGANLAGASVSLDTIPMVPLSQTPSEIRLSMPKHDSGFVVFSVRNSQGTAYAEFLYVPPRLDEIAPGFITTVAGIGNYVRDFGAATSALVGGPSGLAFGRNGVLFVASPLYGKVDQVNPDGTLQRVTHFGGPGLSNGDDGPAIDAMVSFPTSIATDSTGNLYIPDHLYRIRRIDADTGIITSIAGDGTQGSTGDGGLATAARIGVTAFGAAVSGHDFYFIDFDAMRIRRIDLVSGIITTYAGNGPGDSGDGGPALNAKFNVGDSDRGGLAADRHGNLYLADSANGRLRRIERATGTITTIATAPGVRPVAVDENDNIYYGAGGNIVKLAPDGHVLDTWGSGPFTTLPPDGAPAHGTIAGQVAALAIDGHGNVVYSDASVGRVRRINIATQTIETIAGIGPAIIGETGPAIASMVSPTDLALQSDGSILFGDGTLRLRKLDRSGNVSTVAGTGINGGPSYDVASRVTIAAVGIDSDRLGNIDIADATYVRQLRPDGVVAPLVSRNANCGYAGDGGPALDALVCQVWDTAHDRDGNLFFADTNNNRIRRVDAQTGLVTTVIGNGGRRNGFEGYGSGEFCGDGGPALDACINTPYGIAFDASGDLFIAEENRIRKVNMTLGTIETFFSSTHVTKLLFGFGNLLYAARFNDRLLRFDRRGTMTELAGSHPSGDGIGDGGPATNATVGIAHQSAGIVIDAEGNLYFADQGQGRIRAIRYGAVLAPPNATIGATVSGSSIFATVLDGQGAAAPSVRVDFTAPSSGASCRLSSPFGITDANGVAAVSCTSNCAPGSFNVTARPLASSSQVSVAFTNGAAPCRRRAVRH